MTSYETIYNRFLEKITDYEMPTIPEEDLEHMLHGYLVSAISKFRKCKSNLSLRDEDAQCFDDDLLDEEIEQLVCWMVCAWLDPQINSVLLTKQMFGGKEEKYYSQAAHLSELQALRRVSRNEALKLHRDYTYFNNTSYLER